MWKNIATHSRLKGGSKQQISNKSPARKFIIMQEYVRKRDVFYIIYSLVNIVLVNIETGKKM